MHLIMKALEKVTSCVHPNVSEISLLITALSGFLHLNSKKRKKSTAHSLAVFLLFHSSRMDSCMTTSIKASTAHAHLAVVRCGTTSLIIWGENNALTWFYLLDTPSPRASATIWCDAYSYSSVCTSVMLKQYFINFKWEEEKMKGKDWQKGEEKVSPLHVSCNFFGVFCGLSLR